MTETAIFAAGCFWGVQYYFDQVPGVVNSVVGYTGGHTTNPTYEDVCRHGTGHAEALKIEYDADVVTYEILMRHFFRMHDPTQLNRQGPDVGDNYRSVIFYINDQQKQIAEHVKNSLKASFNKPIVTEIVKAGAFYNAEAFHQKYTERTGQGACHVPYVPIT